MSEVAPTVPAPEPEKSAQPPVRRRLLLYLLPLYLSVFALVLCMSVAWPWFQPAAAARGAGTPALSTLDGSRWPTASATMTQRSSATPSVVPSRPPATATRGRVLVWPAETPTEADTATATATHHWDKPPAPTSTAVPPTAAPTVTSAPPTAVPSATTVPPTAVPTGTSAPPTVVPTTPPTIVPPTPPGPGNGTTSP